MDMRSLLGAALITLVGASARPADACERFNDCGDERPGLEWSTWFRLGYGVAGNPTADAMPLAAADAVGAPAPPPQEPAGHTLWDVALGADASFGLDRAGNLRLGAWGELRTSSTPVVGGELLVGAAPRDLDLFWYRGEGLLAVRAGGNRDVMTAAVSYGYRAPWRLWGNWSGPTRYMIGVRLVAAATRAVDDPNDWSATFGVEVEPIGAIRYLLGIRPWY